MKYKKIVIMLILFVFLFGASSAFASDADDAAVASDGTGIELTAMDNNVKTIEDERAINSTIDDESLSAGNDEAVSAENDLDVLGDDVGTYSGLAKELDNSALWISHYAQLKHKYYTYDQGDGIKISAAYSIIDGNGSVIDMAGSHIRAFEVTTEGITFRNLTIINADVGEKGGAIYFDKFGYVENCNFVTNHIGNFGGAVYFNGGECEVINCTFTGNTAYTSGGALYFGNAKAKVINCSFTNNSARYGGGGIYMSQNGDLTNCNFTGNTAFYGSAIYYYGSYARSVSNSRFLNNRANANGNTPFDIKQNDTKIEIAFIGGNNLINAICADYGGVSFTNVVYWGANGIANTGKSPITPSPTVREAGQNVTVTAVVNGIPIFEGTKVTDTGGIIVLDAIAGNYTVTASHDEDSYYTQARKTQTLTIPGNETSLELSAFEYTVTATVTPNTAVGKVTFTVENEAGIVKTTEKTLSNGVAELDIGGLDVKEYNITATYGGNIDYGPSTSNITYLARSTFSRLSGEIGNGGKIKLKYGYYTYDYGSTIEISADNSVIDGNGAVIDMEGSNIQAFLVTASQATVKNLTIKNVDYGSGSGGAIHWNGANGNLYDCVFVNNFANTGSAVDWLAKEGVMSGCVFVNNSANHGTGGAVVWESSRSFISDCVFVNNYYGLRGGAIWTSGSYISISDCVFVNNSADRDGASIRMKGTNCSISGCYFVNHSSASAVVYLLEVENTSVNDNIFLNNNGVAILFQNNCPDSNANYNWFGNNATNYMDKPNVGKCNVWLFLDATANPHFASVSNITDITFKLYAYDSNDVSEYDNNRLKDVELTITPTNGKVNVDKTNLGKSVQFTGENAGAGEITATMENAAYTIPLAITDGTTFFDLNRTINGNSNSVIVLENDYTYVYDFDYRLSEGIVIDRPVTILGNNHTIDAAEFGRIFQVKADDVEIINITFINTRLFTGMEYTAGAILWEGANGIVFDCVFANNSVGNGAALYWEGDYGIVSDCVFVNNSAENKGGAIYLSGNGVLVSGCSFVNNSAANGGAIDVWANDTAVSACVFVNNSASRNGIIYFDNGYHSNLVINDNIFLNNDGVAILFNRYDPVSDADYNWFGHDATNYMDDPNIQSCNVWLFLNGTANPEIVPISHTSNITFKLYAYSSNAVSEYDNNRLKEVNLTIIQTNGKVNTTMLDLGKTVGYTAENLGIGKVTAAIENVAYTITLRNSDGTSFSDLNRDINGNDNNIIVLDKDYRFNSTLDYNLQDGIVINRAVTILGNNHTIDAAKQGRIFYIKADNVEIRNITLINTGMGHNMEYITGAIDWRGNDGILSDCVFVNNSAGDAGAIYWYGNHGVVSDCIFENNSVDFDEGPTYWNREGGAINWFGDDGLVSGCVFVNNSAWYGGAVYWYGGNGVVSGSVFVNNSASRNGTLYFDNKYRSNLTVRDNIFLNNDGVAISFYQSDSTSKADYNWFGHNATNYRDNPNIESCRIWLFLNGTANPDEILISNSSTITFRLYAYNSNVAFGYDNSRLKDINLTLTPTNGKVNTNKINPGKSTIYTAESDGFAKITASIENAAYTVPLTITDGTTFWDLNKAIKGNSNPVIVLDRDYTFNPIFDSEFDNGIVINRAVTINGNGHTINAAEQARAFIVNANNVIIENITFANAKVTFEMASVVGAILWGGDNGKLYNCVFVNNSANYGSGGAVHWSGDDGIAMGCVFVNNSAMYGGAISWYGDDGVVSGCVFVNNTAIQEGIIYLRNEYSSFNIAINDNIFLNNKKVAIYFYQSDSKSNTDYNWFGHNSTNYMVNPNIENCEKWLFLDATQTPEATFISDTCNITFKLYAYQSTGISEYDNSHIKEVTLTLTPTNGNVSSSKIDLGKPVQFTTESVGAKLTAAIENVFNTFTLAIRDGTTFWDLNKTINGNNNDTITLDVDYKFNPLTDGDFKDGVVINRAVRIIGNNHTINALEQARIFKIASDDVTISNIAFINGMATNKDGGAIYWNGAKGIVSDCSFMNNSAKGLTCNGGAIYMTGNANGVVSGCSFVNNSVSDGNGGAIYWINGANANVSDCSFENNVASVTDYSADSSLRGNGAAIYLIGSADGVVSGSSFVNNSAADGSGAIYWNSSSDGAVLDCVFDSNHGEKYGGAIRWDNSDDGIVSGCSFVNNYVYTAGGAIYWNGANGIVSDCSFMNNSANNNRNNGGAIYWEGDDGVISGCYFARNRNYNDIVHFHNLQSGRNMSINNNIFLNNRGTAITFDNYDSASNADYNWFGHNSTNYAIGPNIESCNIWLFLNTTSHQDILPVSGTSDIAFKLYAYDWNGVSEYDCSLLKDVNLTLTSTNGILNTTKVNIGEPVCYTAETPGIDLLIATIENLVYTAPIRISDGKSFWDLNNTINGNQNDTVSLDRDYEYNPITDYAFKEGIVINRAVTIIGNNNTVNGAGQARIFNVKADNVTIKNIEFINAKATEYGAALFWEGANGNVSGCSFVNNSAEDAGTILWHGSNGVVSGCSFVNNSAENAGTILWHGSNGVVSGCSFVNNSADYYAGAIGWVGSDGVVSGCSFVNNSADYAGAVVWLGSNGVVSGCSFVNNSAFNGGAIHWKDCAGGNVSGCSFVNNSAENDGGAIFWEDSAYGTVSNCSFVDNQAGNEGGAISWVRSDGGTVSDCSFVNNSAHDGGAIDWRLNERGTVSGCSFVNNTADYASAIIWDRSNYGNISGSVFVNNRDDGAVVFFYNMGDGHSLAINGNIFLNNNATAIDFVMGDSRSNVDYNWFGNNATDYDTKPATGNAGMNNWLFLNATADPDSISIFESSDILFKLYSYGSAGISEYDNSRLYPVNLTVTATDGRIDGSTHLGEIIKYTATGFGNKTVTGKIENAEYTVEIITIKLNSSLLVEAQEVTYSNNTVIALSYNSTATGTVNITLKGKKSDYAFNSIDLNATISLGSIAADEYDVTVEYSGDDIFNNETATGTLTVNRANSTLTLTDIEFDYNDMGSGEITFTGATGVDGWIIGHDDAIVYIKGNTITVLNLSAGNYILAVTTIPDANHTAVSENATVTVRKVNSTIISNDMVIYYGESVNVTVETDGAVGITVKIDGKDVEVHENTITVPDALKSGNHILTITTLPDDNHTESTKNVVIVDCRADDNIIVIVDGKAYPAKIVNGTVVIDTGSGQIKENTTIELDVSSIENNATFTVSLNPEASGIVRFEVTGAEEYTVYVDVLNGKAIMEDVLAVGNYTVVATYMGDGIFNSNITSESFTIRGHVKKDTSISADANVNGNKVTISVNVDGNATGFVALRQSGTTVYISLENGVATYANTFAPGSYSFEVTYMGDDDFNENSTGLMFTVVDAAKENTTISLDVETSDNIVTFTVDVNENATGIVKFEVTGEGEYISYSDVKEGKAVMMGFMDVGNYTLTVTYMGDDRFNSNATSQRFNVKGHVKVDTPISAAADVNGYRVTITVNVDENATGFVNMKLAGTEFNVALDGGVGLITVTLPASSYNVDVTYLGDENFNENTTKLSFTVEDPVKENTPISLYVSSVEDYATFIVNVDSDASGIVRFEVSGAEDYTVYADVLNGVAVMEDVLEVGDYTVVATYMGDDRFNSNITSQSFAIKEHVRIDTPISANAKVNGNRVTITVNVNESATGFVALKLYEPTMYISVENGVATYIATLAAGSYNVEATYLGDDDFNENSTRLLFTVVESAKINTPIALNVSSVEDYATFTVNVDSDATGIVRFEVSGAEDYTVYADVLNGVAVMEDVLEVGDYTVVATYMGDGRFNSNVTSQSFTIKGHVKVDTPISASADVNGYRVTITVNVDENATGFVNMKLAGTEFNVALDNGVGLIAVTLPASSYNIDVTYLGDENFNENSTKLSFTVEDPVKENTPISLYVSSVEDYATFTVNLNQGATGIVRFEVSGAEDYTVYADVLNGVAVMEDVLEVGDYTVVATYMGDDRFNSNITSQSFTIKEHVRIDTPISASADVNGNRVTITVSVNESATGFVGLKQSGSTIYIVLENGVATYATTLLPGSYNIEATYMGDDNFNENSTRLLFTVVESAKINTPIALNVSSVEDYATFTVNVDSDATGIVRFEVSGAEDYTVYADVLNGVAVMEDVLVVGDYTVVATYMGDGRFNSNVTFQSFTIKGHVKVDTPISAKADVNGYRVTITVNVDENATGFVNMKLAGTEFNVALDGGVGLITVTLPANSYNVDVTYLGDENFNENTTKLSFTVEDPVKENTPISLDVSSIEDYATFIVNVDSDATGIVRFEVSGAEDYTVYADVLNGVAVMEDVLEVGYYTLVATYMGDDRFNTNTTSESFTIKGHIKKDTPITADAKVNGNRVTITVNLNEFATGFVGLKQSGSTIYIALENGVATYTTTFAPGSYNIEARYMGDDNFNENSTRLLFTVVEVSKENTSIALDVEILDNNATFTVDVNENATGIVKFEIGGDEEYVVYRDVNDGKSVMEIFMDAGNYTITVTYMGDSRYNTNVTSHAFSVKNGVKVSQSKFSDIMVSGNAVITARLVDESGAPIANANVVYTVNGKSSVAVTDADGVVVINATTNSVVELAYAGSETILPCNVTVALNDLVPARIASVIKAQDFTQYAVDFKAGERGGYFNVQLVDVNGNPLANKAVKIGFNGVVYDRTTDSNGRTRLQINLANANEVTFAVAFLGDDDYTGSFVVQKITILKKKTSITASAKTFKASAKTKSYTVTLKTVKGSSIDGKTYLRAGKKVTLKINGKTYTAKTNSKGKATFKLSITKKGKFAASIKFAGDNTYLASSKSVKITIK